jgi:hypothetical protein
LTIELKIGIHLHGALLIRYVNGAVLPLIINAVKTGFYHHVEQESQKSTIENTFFDNFSMQA